MTKRFGTLFGHGNDAVVKVGSRLTPEEYRFQFELVSKDPAFGAGCGYSIALRPRWSP
jgi:hypothetical protein